MAEGKQSEVMGELDGIIAGNYERQDTSRAKAFKAELLLGDGEREAALALVNDILKTDNNFEQALLVRAHYHILADDIDSAVSDLRVVLRNNSESEQALVMLANAYLSSGSSQLADDIFRKVLDINPGNVHAAVPVIQSLLEKKDIDRSERVLEAALSRSPDNDILLSILAQIKVSKKDFEGGKKIISQIVANGKNPSFSHYLAGRTLQAEGDCRGAIEQYKQALTQNPELSRALEGLSLCFVELKRGSDLATYLREFRASNPKNMMALSVLASVYERQGNTDAAVATLEEGLAQDATWVQGYTALASTYRAAKDPTSAIQSLERGLVALPESALLKTLLASSYERSGDKTKAMQLYEEVLAVNPNHEGVINNLASLLTDYFSSPENIKRAVKLTERFASSSHPYFIDSYAWALIKSGNPAAAGPLLARAIQMEPSTPIFYYHRGVGLRDIGKQAEAKKMLLIAKEKAKKSDPLLQRINDALNGF